MARLRTRVAFGLAFVSMGFPLLGREHPVIAVAGLVALIGLVGFYAWARRPAAPGPAWRWLSSVPKASLV